MLTPAHQNHRVQTIKKSLKSVVDSISNSYKELETYRQRLLAEKESILNHR